MTSLSLYEDLLAPGERLELAAGGRIVYVASGELASLHAGSAAFGADERITSSSVTAHPACSRNSLKIAAARIRQIPGSVDRATPD